MMKYQSTYTGFGVHHHTFGKLYADILRVEELPNALLIFEPGAGRITEAIALSTVLGREPVVHSHGWRIGETPILADAAMQPLSAGFGGFDRLCLHRVGDTAED